MHNISSLTGNKANQINDIPAKNNCLLKLTASRVDWAFTQEMYWEISWDFVCQGYVCVFTLPLSLSLALSLSRFVSGNRGMDSDGATSERILLEPYKYLLQLPGKSNAKNKNDTICLFLAACKLLWKESWHKSKTLFVVADAVIIYDTIYENGLCWQIQRVGQSSCLTTNSCKNPLLFYCSGV